MPIEWHNRHATQRGLSFHLSNAIQVTVTHATPDNYFAQPYLPNYWGLYSIFMWPFSHLYCIHVLVATSCSMPPLISASLRFKDVSTLLPTSCAVMFSSSWQWHKRFFLFYTFWPATLTHKGLWKLWIHTYGGCASLRHIHRDIPTQVWKIRTSLSESENVT